MAFHGDQQLHAALVDALTGLTTTGNNVIDDDTTAIGDDRLPALRVLDDGESQIEYATIRPPRTLIRTQTYSVHLLVKAQDGYAQRNAALAEIEAALYANRTLGGLARDVRIGPIDKENDDATDESLRRAIVTVTVDWVCAEGSPTVPL